MIHLPSYLFFISWEIERFNSYNGFFCPFCFYTNVYFTYSNNNSNKTQVHKTFLNDEKFYCKFCSEMVWASLCISPDKTKKNPPYRLRFSSQSSSQLSFPEFLSQFFSHRPLLLSESSLSSPLPTHHDNIVVLKYLRINS